MLRVFAFIPVVTIAVTLPAMAQQKSDLPKEGKYDFTSCYAGAATTIDFSKAASALGYEVVGTSRSNPPGGFLDMSAFRCVGSGATFDGKYSGTSICEATDKDGDKILTRLIFDGPKSTVDTAIGTGKYEGIVRTGGTEPLGPFPSVKPGTLMGCNHATGTYKLKEEATGTSTLSK